jgi:hypothetical protein
MSVPKALTAGQIIPSATYCPPAGISNTLYIVFLMTFYNKQISWCSNQE